MKTYAPVVSLVTTKDGTCPGGYIQIESVVVNGALQARIRELERALRHMHDSHHKQPCVCWIQDLLRCSPSRPDNVSLESSSSDTGKLT